MEPNLWISDTQKEEAIERFKDKVERGLDPKKASVAAYIESRQKPHQGKPQLWNTILLPEKIEWQDLPETFEARNGTLWVMMHPVKQQEGSILLPDRYASRFRPDCGFVIAGEHIGDLAIVLPFAGTRFNDVEGYPEQVRIYGIHSRDECQPCYRHWGESVVGLVPKGGKMEQLRATHHNVLIKREPVEQGEILVAGKQRDQYAQIVSVGNLAQEAGYKVGDRVVYNSRALVIGVECNGDTPAGGDWKDYAFIKHQELYGVVKP